MDLLKIKLENCYGIPFLDKDFDFSGGQNRPKAYAIYAPNGLMKTSFARTFEDLAKGKEPKEERYNRTATYVVEADVTAVPKEMMYVLKAEIDIREDSPAISDILVNPENKARYDELLVDLDEKKKKVINALQRTSKVPKNDVEEKILQDWGEGDLPACIEKIKGISPTADLTGFVYATIFDSKALQVLKSQEFIAKANEFNDRYQELFSQAGTIYQKGVFNPTKAEASFSTLNKQGFFAGGHRVHLRGEKESVSKEELDEKLEKLHARIDGDEALKRLRLNLCVFRANLTTDSDANHPPVPTQSIH